MRRGAYRDSGPIGLSQFDDTIITNHSQHLNEEPSSPKDYNLNYRCINFMEGNYKSQGTVGSGVSAVEGARVTEQVIGAVAGAGQPSIASSPTPAPTEPRASPPASSGAASKHAAGAIARSFAEVASAEGKWRVVILLTAMDSLATFEVTIGSISVMLSLLAIPIFLIFYFVFRCRVRNIVDNEK
ncbi:unnamed protein product [Parnassius apollo]|uniref:(apollo) hypothetical protein n=1 Tax=Parnassius apollo TaxID=110799 RepID=A0A8S3W9R3_PARAO|nr:unnamed protein product [Parnassius apollo]